MSFSGAEFTGRAFDKIAPKFYYFGGGGDVLAYFFFMNGRLAKS